MSNNKKLFANAIADAKALREVAVANAKASLEESFMPRIQSMFEKRIMEAEELEEAEDELKENEKQIRKQLDDEYEKIKNDPFPVKADLFTHIGVTP